MSRSYASAGDSWLKGTIQAIGCVHTAGELSAADSSGPAIWGRRSLASRSADGQYGGTETRLVRAQADVFSVIREAGVQDLAVRGNRLRHRDAHGDDQELRGQHCRPAALLRFQVRARFRLDDQEWPACGLNRTTSQTTVSR